MSNTTGPGDARPLFIQETFCRHAHRGIFVTRDVNNKVCPNLLDALVNPFETELPCVRNNRLLHWVVETNSTTRMNTHVHTHLCFQLVQLSVIKEHSCVSHNFLWGSKPSDVISITFFSNGSLNWYSGSNVARLKLSNGFTHIPKRENYQALKWTTASQAQRDTHSWTSSLFLLRSTSSINVCFIIFPLTSVGSSGRKVAYLWIAPNRRGILFPIDIFLHKPGSWYLNLLSTFSLKLYLLSSCP